MSRDAVAVDADQKFSFEAAAATGDTSMQDDSTKGKLFLYVNGAKVAWLKD